VSRYDEDMGETPFDDDRSTRAASLDEIHRVRLKSARVRVVAGPDARAEATVGPAGIFIGSGTGCDLRLSDPRVSRRHLELRAEEGGVRAVDRASLNGTFLGSARVHDLLLVESTTLHLGGTTIAVDLLAEPLDVRFSSRTRFGDAIAHSQSMRHVFSLLEQAARGDVTVLLEGESGTGKEVLAHGVHAESARRDGPFVVVDCGAMPENLVESELFGHEKGAFTGAVGARVGAFEQADGGTLFLDEIGELPLESQPKLLRALESRSFRRVGGSKTITVDVRIVAATNRRLREAVRRKEFREDLFYRLAVVHVAVPRLADRKDDVALLAESFLRRATRDEGANLPADLGRLLASYDWPGNARELRNVIERFATFRTADARVLFGARDAGGGAGAGAGARGETDAPFDFAELEGLPYHEAKQRLVEAFHRTVLVRAVERAGGQVPRAAELLGIPKASLYRMLQELRDHDEEPPEEA
jgi:transcriptional regulator with PAS, ATPase and Fis domain